MRTNYQYELIYPVPEDTGAKERIEKKLDIISKKIGKEV